MDAAPAPADRALGAGGLALTGLVGASLLAAVFAGDGSGVDGASCATAADVNTVSSAAAEKTIERWVMTNMSVALLSFQVQVRGDTINETAGSDRPVRRIRSS